MSIIPLTETVKNTVEVFNDIYEISGPHLQWTTFLKFFVKISFDWFIYFLSFQWLYDFVRLPVFVPQIAESIFSEIPHADLSFLPMEPSKNFIGTCLISGFFNCFFLYFPVSSVHWIWLKYVLLDSQAVPWAGRAATLGLIFGNLSLFGLCLCGCRPILNIWFGLEPLSYFLGVWLVLKVIFEMVHSPAVIRTRYSKKQLWKIFFVQCACVWVDQSGFYQFFGNLSLQSGFSVLDFVHSSVSVYFLGIVLGSVFWTFVISQTLNQMGYLFPKITKYTYSVWVQGVYSFCLIGCVTLTFTSFAFYGTGYLLANPLGFAPQDHALELISLSTQTKDTSQGRLGEKSSFGSVDTDLSSFDRGRYAGGPVAEFHIESLNYQDEYAWRSRIDRFSSRGLNRGGGILDQFITTQLGPVDQALQRQRKHKKRLQQVAKLKRKNQIEMEREKKKFGEAKKRTSLPPLKIEKDFMENYGQLVERYIEDYAAEGNSEDKDIPDLSEEKMIRYSAFSELAKYGFDVFSIIDSVELDPFDEELTRDLKEKFSENLINKFLMRLDISTFLKRQPKSHQLDSREEISLFYKRLALAEYFDTLRSYFQLPQTFQSVFCGPKSYANRVYNQQFKGTLKIVERLFSIHLEDKKNIPILEESKETSRSKKTPPSEQLKSLQKSQRTKPQLQPQPQKKQRTTENVTTRSNYGAELEAEYLRLKQEQKDKSVLKFDQPLYKTHFLHHNPLIHEQFLDQMPSLIYEADVQPFLKEGSSSPFFVGWDNEQRKFVVTNRILNRENTLSKISFPKDINYRKFSSQKNATPTVSPQATPMFTFTAWPVLKKDLQNQPAFSRLFSTYEELESSSEELFKYAEPLMEEDTLIYKQLPNLALRVNLELKDQPPLAPRKGGWVWSGNPPLKYKVPFISFFERFFNEKRKK